MKKGIIVLLVLLFAITPFSFVNARIGVGVGTGKIVVNDDLKPGQIYELPSITVVNTGDEKSDYTLAVEYHDGYTEIKPPREWFTYEPKIFSLEPQQTQVVKVFLSIPLNATPGDYFSYVEARPSKRAVTDGGASVGVAAGSKLYFKVVPANIFSAIYHRLVSVWNIYMPWSQRIVGALALGILVLLFRKYFNIDIKPRTSNNKND